MSRGSLSIFFDKGESGGSIFPHKIASPTFQLFNVIP